MYIYRKIPSWQQYRRLPRAHCTHCRIGCSHHRRIFVGWTQGARRIARFTLEFSGRARCAFFSIKPREPLVATAIRMSFTCVWRSRVRRAHSTHFMTTCTDSDGKGSARTHCTPCWPCGCLVTTRRTQGARHAVWACGTCATGATGHWFAACCGHGARVRRARLARPTGNCPFWHAYTSSSVNMRVCTSCFAAESNTHVRCDTGCRHCCYVEIAWTWDRFCPAGITACVIVLTLWHSYELQRASWSHRAPQEKHSCPSTSFALSKSGWPHPLTSPPTSW